MILRIPFLASALAFLASLFVSNSLAQVELAPNTIRGKARFSNTDPTILGLLAGPEDEGLSYLYVYASSLPDHGRIAGSGWASTTSRVEKDYEIAVDSAAEGVRYLVAPRASLLDNQQTYYFEGLASDPVVAGQPGPTLD